MVNVSKLEQYLEKRGYTWDSLNKEIGGLPATIEEFASSFEDEATADVILHRLDHALLAAAKVLRQLGLDNLPVDGKDPNE